MSGRGKKKKDREEDEMSEDSSSSLAVVEGRGPGRRPPGDMVGQMIGESSTPSQSEASVGGSDTASMFHTMSALILEMKTQREQDERWRLEQQRLMADEAARRDAELAKMREQAADERATSLKVLEERIQHESVLRAREAQQAREAAELRHQVSDALRRLPKLEKGEDIVAFLECFEQSLEAAGVPRASWARYVPDYLTGKAKEVFCGNVPVDSRTDYQVIRSILIETLSKPAGVHVAECFGWVKPYKASPGEVVAKVKASLNSGFGVFPFPVLMMTTLSAYNQECINTVLAKKPDHTPDLVKAISDFEATHGNATKAEKVVAGSRRAFSPPQQQGGTFRKWGGPGEKNVDTNELAGTNNNSNALVKSDSSGECKPYVKREVVCYLCHKPGHKRPECPLKKDTANE